MVTSWREAKPCVAALVAAATGDTSRLRTDQRRPELWATDAASDGGSEVHRSIAVEVIVVMAGEEQQTPRIMEWASHQGLPPQLRLVVTCGAAQLHRELRGLVAGRPREVSVAGVVVAL